MYWGLGMRPSENALAHPSVHSLNLSRVLSVIFPAVIRVGKTLDCVAHHARKVALVPALVRCAERLHVFRTHVSASCLKERKVGRAI